MSGIEVVGLVLGVWPVMLNIIDAWKATKGGIPEQQLAVNIKLYARIYRETISKLLQGDENLSEKDRIGLLNGEKDFAAIWTDPEFVARLKKQLDSEMISILELKTAEIHRNLETLKKKIESKEADSDKKELQKKGAFARVRAMRLTLQKKEIKKCLDELRDNVNVVRNLLEPYSTATYAPVRRPAVAAHSHQRHPSEERRARKQIFDDFYEVIRDSFQCQCGVAHEANLRLSDSLELIFPIDADPASPGQVAAKAVSEFHMRTRALTIDSQMSTSPNDPEDTDYASTSDVFRTTWSKGRQSSVTSAPSEHRGILVMFDQSVGIGRNLAEIEDLCQYLHKLKSFPPPSSPKLSPPLESRGIVGRDGKKYTVNPKIQDQCSSPTVISMDECLNSLSGYGMSRRTRLDLALHLATAIVQFYPTRWIDLGWTWQNFSMLRGDTSHHLCITRRFWSLGARRESLLPPPSKFWRIIRDKDPLLVRLGFALIELAMGKRLSEIKEEPRFRAHQTMDSDDESVSERPENEFQKDSDDWNTANDLVDTNYLRDEVSPGYQQLVATCLRCEVLQDVGTKPLSSQSKTFEEDISRYVVEPLRQYHVDTWGPYQVAAF